MSGADYEVTLPLYGEGRVPIVRLGHHPFVVTGKTVDVILPDVVGSMYLIDTSPLAGVSKVVCRTPTRPGLEPAPSATLVYRPPAKPRKSAKAPLLLVVVAAEGIVRGGRLT